MNLQSILTAIVSHLQTSVSQEKLTASRVKQVTSTICKVQEYVRAMNKMKIQDQEFAYLKAIALFGTGNGNAILCRGDSQSQQIKIKFEHFQICLGLIPRNKSSTSAKSPSLN